MKARMLTIKEAAELAGVEQRFITSLCNRGTLQCDYVDGKRIIYEDILLSTFGEYTQLNFDDV